MSTLLIEALDIIEKCLYYSLIGKAGYNHTPLARLREIIMELRKEVEDDKALRDTTG